MNLTIKNASMTRSEEDGYVGKVVFEVEGHKQPYEVTLHSKKGREWSYGLFFAEESGSEEQLTAVEDFLEENDEWFDKLVEAAKASVQEQGI